MQPATTWAPAVYQPTNLVRVERPPEPDDSSFRCLKNMSLWSSYAVFVVLT
jgi:hypothetical protein